LGRGDRARAVLLDAGALADPVRMPAAFYADAGVQIAHLDAAGHGRVLAAIFGLVASTERASDDSVYPCLGEEEER
jgi:hypothetical protein